MTQEQEKDLAGLVERLREWADGDIRELIRDQHRMGVSIDEADGEKWASLMEEAAAAIESLTAKLGVAEQALQTANGQFVLAMNHRIAAEAKLSIALEALKKVEDLSLPPSERVLGTGQHLVGDPGPDAPPPKSWYCEPCAVAVHERRCPHCGKLKGDKS